MPSSSLGGSTEQRNSDNQEGEFDNTNWMTKKASEIESQKIASRLEKDLHQKRVQLLRKELDYLKTTEWKYKPIDR